MRLQKVSDMHLLEKIKAGGIVLVILGLLSVAAWLTHIFNCLQDGEWGFLIAGALFFPIAIIHGFGIWLGVW